MFKENDYIVCLEGDFTMNNGKDISSIARKNYCVKQQQVSHKLYIYDGIDDSVSKTNGNFTFDKDDKLHDWRYATEAEILHYNTIGKPYDVTTLQPIKPEDTSYLIEIFAKNNIT